MIDSKAPNLKLTLVFEINSSKLNLEQILNLF